MLNCPFNICFYRVLESNHATSNFVFLKVAATFHDNSMGKVKLNYVVSRLVLITNKEVNIFVFVSIFSFMVTLSWSFFETLKFGFNNMLFEFRCYSVML